MAASRRSPDDERSRRYTPDTDAVDESYEYLVDVRGRLQRDTPDDETFVWTAEESTDERRRGSPACSTPSSVRPRRR